MRRWAAMGAMLLLATGCSVVQGTAQTDDGWVSLFDGETLNGWRASENPATFRVENGVIVHAVDGITIAGNLRDMFRDIRAVGSERDPRSHIGTGPILLDRMTVAGGE